MMKSSPDFPTHMGPEGSYSESNCDQIDNADVDFGGYGRPGHMDSGFCPSLAFTLLKLPA